MQSRFGRRDGRGQSQVTVRFGGTLGLRYAPTCVQVTPGTQVIFSGQFDEHPLVGGEVPPRGTMLDPSSPLAPPSSGTLKTFTLPAAGSFLFYDNIYACNIHALVGMKGAVFAVP